MRNNNGAFNDKDGRHIRFGLDNTSSKRSEHIKSSDLIGIKSVVITKEMIGQTIGIFVAVEVKKPNWSPDKKLDKHEQAQGNFLQWVRERGGIAGFCNSVDSLMKLLGR